MPLFRRLANVFHRDIVRKPRILARHPAHELTLDFRFVLADYLTRNPRPFFVQVGGFDGVTCDPIHETVCRAQLPGIVIEPQRWAFERLQQAYVGYPNVRLVRAALAAADGEAVLHKVRDDVDAPHHLRGLASFNKAVLLKHQKRWPRLADSLGVETVPAITFATLFRAHGIERVDILQVDTEGFDFEVLKLFDVPARQPSLIHFEHKHLTAADLNAALALLIGCGYR